MDDRYSHQARARLALSAAAKELSDYARGLVSADDRGSGPGEVVERAVQLVDDARGVLERAVVYERERGASWQTIGAALGRPAKGSVVGSCTENTGRLRSYLDARLC